jgi:hypothetical protein
MSHLGQRLSALIDGELSGAERDRVLAHVARCDGCRQEAAALRALKQRMHSLGEAMVDTALTGRLMAMAASGEARDAQPRWRPRVLYTAARWLAAGLVASAMAGVGVTAFFVGGEQQDPGPKVTPAVDFFVAQHGTVTGDVPAAPTGAAPSGAEPSGAEPSSTEPSSTGPSSTGPSSTGPSRTEPSSPGLAGAGAAARRAGRAVTRVSGAAASAARAALRAGASAAPSLTDAPPAQRVTARTPLLWPARRGAALVTANASPGP